MRYIAYYILGIVFFISACEKPDEIGLALQPSSENIQLQFTDTITVETSTILADSVVTSNVNDVLVGSYKDPVFGTVTSHCATQILLSRSNLSFPPDAILDSVVLRMDYLQSYGNQDFAQTINVYEMVDDLYFDSLYYNTTQKTPGKILGTTTFKASDYNTLVVNGGFVFPEFRIPLNNAYFYDKIVAKSGDTVLADNPRFLKHFKGLYLLPQFRGEGSVLSFKVKSGNSYVRMYYHDLIDTVFVDFPINESCARFNYLQADRNSTALTSLTDTADLKESDTGNKLFLQSGTGIKIKLTFPYLENFKTLNGIVKQVVINKAELVGYVDPSYSTYIPPADLLIYPKDSLSNDPYIFPLVSENQNIDAIPNSGTTLFIKYDDSKKNYVAGITSYFQAMVLNKKPDDGFLLSSTRLGLSLNRAQLYGANWPDEKKRFKLRVFYTAVK